MAAPGAARGRAHPARALLDRQVRMEVGLGRSPATRRRSPVDASRSLDLAPVDVARASDCRDRRRCWHSPGRPSRVMLRSASSVGRG